MILVEKNAFGKNEHDEGSREMEKTDNFDSSL